MKRKNIHGFAIPVALGIIIFLGLLILSFSSFTSSQKRLINKSFQKEITLHLSENISRMLTAYINKRVLGTTGQRNLIYEDLVYQNILSSELSRLDLSQLDDHMPGLVDYAHSFGITIDDFSIKYLDVVPIEQPVSMIKNDPVEKYGKIRIQIKARYRQTCLKLDIEKEFRVVNLIPPVVSKFTLFVKDPPSDTDLNCIVNQELTGKVTGTTRPLICYNAGVVTELESALIQKKGWIFLGGDTWYLNIASGNQLNPVFDNFGQDFHLMPWMTITTKEKCPVDQHNVKLLQQGFFDGMEDPAVSRNLASLSSTYNTKSNGIHLYGDTENKSTTLVVGDVRPRFLMYGALTWNHPAGYSGPLDFYSLNYRMDQTDFQANPKTILHDAPPTTATNHYHDHELTDNPGVNPSITLCTDDTDVAPANDCTVFYYTGAPDPVNDYIHYMSRVVNGDRDYENWAIHYNQAYDRIKNSYTYFELPLTSLDLLNTDNIGDFITYGTPASTLFPVGIDKTFFYNCNSYSGPLINGMVKIKNDAAEELFDGALYQLNALIKPEKFTNVIDLDADVAFNSASSLPDPARTFDILFVDRTASPWELHLNSILYCNTASSSVTINNTRLDVQRGGMIISEKNIIIAGSITNTNPNELLTIISMEGDIIIDTDQPVQASLIALKGSLKKTCPGPLSISGSVAVKEIDASVFQVNNKRTTTCPIHASVCSESYVMYDYRFNPINKTDYTEFYRVFLSPRNLFVKISSY